MAIEHGDQFVVVKVAEAFSDVGFAEEPKMSE
jgi:hypothetical protein